MSDLGNAPFRDGDLLAAVDLGSNSFHMVVARCERGEPRVIDRLRESVRLAAGLHADGSLAPARRAAAMRCLARMGQRLAGLPPHRVRAVATSTVRQLRAPMAFLRPAERALGHAIEVVSGREEARLIWQGVAHALPDSTERRLVIDVGGGSTEFIIGRNVDPEMTESVQIGCVASTLRFFPNGRITRNRWERAHGEISVLLQQFAAGYQAAGWSEAWGASGTFRAIASIAEAMGASRGDITPAALRKIRDRLIRAGSAAKAALPGLGVERLPIIAGGLLVVDAAFTSLGIERLHATDVSMREGMLWDMLGRAAGRDPRSASIRALALRHRVDRAQAARVEAMAGMLFDAAASGWRLDGSARNWLLWAARVHELGLAIAHSRHQHHAGYVLRHADLPGFSNQEQLLLAAIVENHRRRPGLELLTALPLRLRDPVRRVTVLLRLAALFCRAHDAPPIPRKVSAHENALRIALTATWRRRYPLTLTDLEAEQALLRGLDIKLVLEQA